MTCSSSTVTEYNDSHVSTMRILEEISLQRFYIENLQLGIKLERKRKKTRT